MTAALNQSYSRFSVIIQIWPNIFWEQQVLQNVVMSFLVNSTKGMLKTNNWVESYLQFQPEKYWSRRKRNHPCLMKWVKPESKPAHLFCLYCDSTGQIQGYRWSSQMKTHSQSYSSSHYKHITLYQPVWWWWFPLALICPLQWGLWKDPSTPTTSWWHDY